MDRDTAYRSCIPAKAEERVVSRHPDGSTERAEYWLDGERVGDRQFDESGVLIGEGSYRAGVPHGMFYRWAPPGELISTEPWENGVPHGTAYQWGREGKLLGTYTLDRGMGIDLWRQERDDGSVALAEVYFMRDGRRHGYEWWLDHDDQHSVEIERHWANGNQHGIEREWNHKGRLCRGHPRYWIRGERVTKRQYLREAARNSTLPAFRPEENIPERSFPPEIRQHLALH